jgi:hypothetical protein
MAESTRDVSDAHDVRRQPGLTHTMVELVELERVPEPGCASGCTSQALRDRRGATVVGVEPDAEAAQLRARTQRILVGAAEGPTRGRLPERFDAIVSPTCSSTARPGRCRSVRARWWRRTAS